jgi:ankyrin repeat protein
LYLIQKGIDVNMHGTVADCGAITNVAQKGYLDIVKILYENGAKIEVSNSARNPLFAAIYGGHYEVAKFLIDKGIDITASYSIGKLENVDAYEYARQFGQLEIAEYIREKLKEKK